MKTICLTFILTVFTINVFGQKCSCSSNPNLKELISCQPIFFKNKAKLYWQYNCHSSWLVFKNILGEKRVLFTLKDEGVELTTRIGFTQFIEYENTFLGLYKVSSGCCDPPEFSLFDKNNGKLKRSLGRLVFFSEDTKQPYIAYLKGSNTHDFEIKDYQTLIVQNINNSKIKKISFTKGKVKQALERIGEAYPEYLFSEAKISKGIFSVEFGYDSKDKQKEILKEKLTLKLD